MNTLSFVTRWIGQVDGVAASVHKSLKGQAKSPHMQAGLTSRTSASAFCFEARYRRLLRGRNTPLILLFNLSQNYHYCIFFYRPHIRTGCLVMSRVVCYRCPFVQWKSGNNSRLGDTVYVCICSFRGISIEKYTSTWYNNSYALHRP